MARGAPNRPRPSMATGGGGGSSNGADHPTSGGSVNASSSSRGAVYDEPPTAATENTSGTVDAALLALATRQPGDGKGRPVYSVENLPQNSTIKVYSHKKTQTTFLGKLNITQDHKIADLVVLLHDELGLRVSAIARGSAHSSLIVPIHVKQYGKPAMFFFPADDQHLVVTVR